MNSWQILQQVRYLLRLQTWPSSSNVVFHRDSVICTEHAEDEALKEAIAPLALLSVGGSVPDPENPNLRSEDVKILLAVINELDRLGEATLLGGGRVGGATDSRGRGLLEVQERVEDAVMKLSPANGVRVAFVGSSFVEARRHPSLGMIALRELGFTAWLSSAKTYQPATSFRASVAGSTVTGLWKYPGLRFDTRRAIVRRLAGSVAPASASAGTGLVLGGAPDGSGVVTFADHPGSGTWSYALFIAYDEFGSSTDEAFSAAVTVTGVVVP